MALPDWAKQVLTGGLPALIDGGSNPPVSPTKSVAPETTAPTPTVQDKDPTFSISLGNVSQTQILAVTAGIIAIIGIVYFMRK